MPIQYLASSRQSPMSAIRLTTFTWLTLSYIQDSVQSMGHSELFSVYFELFTVQQYDLYLGHYVLYTGPYQLDTGSYELDTAHHRLCIMNSEFSVTVSLMLEIWSLNSLTPMHISAILICLGGLFF